MRALALVAVVISLPPLASAGTRVAVPTLRTPQQRQMAAVVSTWTKRLDANDNAGLARLFTLPATLIQPPYELKLTTRAEIADWHSGLPCSGRIVALSFRRNTATATFRLANRGATKCDAPGTLAAARFTIVKGLISTWEQAALPPRPAGQTA
jgi:hypothetical protein